MEKNGLPDESSKRIEIHRLLVAKQLYLHALNHSQLAGAINKIIAVHNFHNSIEIVLKAIIIRYNIKSADIRYITFENMLSEIDKFPEFKKKSITIPYRHDLRNLNQIRNLVQHQANEPSDSSMDEWRVFSLRFLREAYKQYFDFIFDDLSQADFIVNESIRKLVKYAEKNIDEEPYHKSWAPAKLAFQCAYDSFSTHFVKNHLVRDRYSTFKASSLLVFNTSVYDRRKLYGLEESFDKIYKLLHDEIWNLEEITIIIASGIDLKEFIRFKDLTSGISFSPYGGEPYINIIDSNVDVENSKWLVNFAIDSILRWELSGIIISIPEHYKNSVQEFTKIHDTSTGW